MKHLPLRLGQLLHRRGHPADTVDALRACAEPMAVIPASESAESVAGALRRIGSSMRVVGEVYGTRNDQAVKSRAQPSNA